MNIKDRIKELRRIKACDLVPNQKNWRKHPKEQKEALEGILSEIGYANALLAYESSEGLKLIDGHLRAETTPDMEVPVLILDVNEEEAEKILLTIDPLGAMAEADAEKLDSLMREVQTANQAVANMLADLASSSGLYKIENETFDDKNDSKEKLSFGVISYNLIFDDENQQTEWYEWLKKLKTKYPDLETHSARIIKEIVYAG